MTSSVLRQLAQEPMMQTFATPAPITAVVSVPAGRIQITATDRDTATVEIRPADPAKGIKYRCRKSSVQDEGYR